METWRTRPPVPKARADGFTSKKRRLCIKTLAKTGCISDAARVAGVSRKTINDWRAKDPDFDRLCTVAIDKAAGHIETLAWERAVTGIEEPVVHHGKLVGTRLKRSDAIFRMLLMASNKEKYGRMGAADRAAIEHELRAKVEEEEVRASLLPRVASDEEVREALGSALRAYRARAERRREERGRQLTVLRREAAGTVGGGWGFLRRAHMKRPMRSVRCASPCCR